MAPATHSTVPIQGVLNPVPLQAVPSPMASTYPQFTPYQPPGVNTLLGTYQVVTSQLKLPIYPVGRDENQFVVFDVASMGTMRMNVLRRKLHRDKEIHEVSLNPDPGAPTIDVIIDGVLILGVQVDDGSSVNLMTEDTMEKLGLTRLLPTTLLLCMADHSKVHPMGVLVDVETIIAGIAYKIDYVVFQLKSSALSYPILLDRPWLFHAKARNDWGRGTLTIGKKRNKIVLQMYPVSYHGESQVPCTEFTSEGHSESSDDEDPFHGNEQYEQIQSLTKHTGVIYQCGGIGEYLIHQEDTDNSDHAIARWMNNYAVNYISAIEPEMDGANSSELVTGSEPDEQLEAPELVEPVCQEINLGLETQSQPIQVYGGIQGRELQDWINFFHKHKPVFAWTYNDLRGIPAEIAEHRIVLEETARPIRQRQHRLNSKYSLLVKEELDKLLRVGFIYEVPYSEWVSPIVMVPKKNGKIRIYQDYRKLNAVTKKDYFPLPFTDIMPFGLCNAPATFQRVMTQAFHKYLRSSMEIFLDDFCTFSKRCDHLKWLGNCLDQCDHFGISLNSEKCTFGVPLGKLLGHIVSKKGIATDPDKVKKIANLLRPDTVAGVRVIVRPGKSHANVDHLSRLTKEMGDDPIPDSLPDANLFAVDIISKDCGGHFAGDAMARKALLAGYWWPTMFADGHQYVRHCDPCQRIGRPTVTSAMPLVPILAQTPFKK
ncbi:uncharacterized protein [Physcomitrium patens]|uniref:uncharacterized protein n=1 Tax=Physcomitrium patens TaxID=3218 RepID=UPI003CCE27B9